jgi:N-hydroxyarylamine O-acetyltransferase
VALPLADRYLDVLGVADREPNAGLLAEITRRHVAEFPFASLGPRLGDDLPLDPLALFDRIVVRRRGGYCFEQNGLLFEVLAELGFSVRLQMARVIHNQDVHPGLTHRVTRVEAEGQEYVVDVGFGPMGPPLPVSMRADESEPVADRYRVHEPRPGEFHMQTVVDENWFSLYRFDAVTYGQSDAESGHFYSHRHPQATFVNNLVASRILDAEVRSLRNRTYWVLRETDPTTETVADPERLHELLTDELGLGVTMAESRRLFDDLPAD